MSDGNRDTPVMGAGSMNDEAVARLLALYGLGPTSFAGSRDALYERHLMFDNAVGLPAAGPRCGRWSRWPRTPAFNPTS
jgi:starch phosphorylase